MNKIVQTLAYPSSFFSSSSFFPNDPNAEDIDENRVDGSEKKRKNYLVNIEFL